MYARTLVSTSYSSLTIDDIVESKEIITRFRLLANSREMREGLAIGFHAVTFLQFAFAVFYDYTYTIVPDNVTRVHRAFGGKFKFLTFWDAVSIYRSFKLQISASAQLWLMKLPFVIDTCMLHTEYTTYRIYIHTHGYKYAFAFISCIDALCCRQWNFVVTIAERKKCSL